MSSNTTQFATVTILTSGTLSNALFLGPAKQALGCLLSIRMPAGWDAADLTLQGIHIGDSAGLDSSTSTVATQTTGWNWVDLREPVLGGRVILKGAVAGGGIILAPQDTMGWWALRLRSASATNDANTVTQTADRAIMCAYRTFE